MQVLVKLTGPNRRVWFLSEDGETITHIRDCQKTFPLGGSASGGDTPVIEGVYRYKGSVDKYSDLPTDGNDIGDVWNVLEAHESYAAGMNYAWTGTEWDAIGGTTYTAGSGIAISDGKLSVNIDGSTIIADANGVLSATGGGTEYTNGTGITIDRNNAISVNIDNDTITATDGVLAARGGRDFAVGVEKPYGTYTDENNVTYKTYSKIIYIPALPATAGITTYEHGIDNIKQILDIYGFTTDGFVLNAPRQAITDNITIYQASKSASNKTFSIEVGKDRSSKKAYVTVIYAKNN